MSIIRRKRKKSQVSPERYASSKKWKTADINNEIQESFSLDGFMGLDELIDYNEEDIKTLVAGQKKKKKLVNTESYLEEECLTNDVSKTFNFDKQESKKEEVKKNNNEQHKDNNVLTLELKELLKEATPKLSKKEKRKLKQKISFKQKLKERRKLAKEMKSKQKAGEVLIENAYGKVKNVPKVSSIDNKKDGIETPLEGVFLLFFLLFDLFAIINSIVCHSGYLTHCLRFLIM